MAFITPTNYPLLAPSQEIGQPFSVDQFGEISYTQDQSRATEWHVLAILLTAPGERVMRPNFGAGLLRFVFENDDPLTVAGLQADASTQIQVYEPNVSLDSLSAEQDSNNPGQVNVAVTYKIGKTGQPFRTVITSTGQVVETQ